MARERRTYAVRIELTGGPRLAPVQLTVLVARALERELGQDRLTAVHAQPGRPGGLEGGPRPEAPPQAPEGAQPGILAAWVLRAAEALRDGRPMGLRRRRALADSLQWALRQDEQLRLEANLGPAPEPEAPDLTGATCYHRVPLQDPCPDCRREAGQA